MAALDDDLELLLQHAPPQQRVQVLADWAGSDQALISKGVKLLAPIEDGTAVVELALATAATLKKDPDIGHMELLPGFGPELDVSRVVIKAPKAKAGGGFDGPTGKGVTVGVIDADFDVFHQSLRNSDGSTRFIALWDMHPAGKSAKIDNLAAPDGFVRGVLYSKGDIDLAFSAPTAGEGKQVAKRRQKLSGNLRMLRGRGHGSGVASIAAGNGRLSNGTSSGNIGIAPDAALAGVVMRSPHDWAMAMRFLRNILKGTPAVINLSAGEHHGPHLPGGRVERWFETFIDKSGIPLVKSAGNTGSIRGHTTGTVKKNASTVLQLVMEPGASSLTRNIRVQIWYGYGGGSPQLTATIAPPASRTAYSIPYDGDCNAPPSLIKASNRKRDGQLGLSCIVLWLQPKPGTWTVRLTAPKDADVKWHAWISWSDLYTGMVSFPAGGLVSDATTISVPAAVPNMVTVASFVTKGKDGTPTNDLKIAPGSSKGPAADGTSPAITIAAPGQYILAAEPPDPLSAEPPPGTTDRYDLNAGTSFAAPHVTGAIALMLEKNPTLTPKQILTILRTKESGDNLDENTWGAGRLDIERLLKLVPTP
ncbi:S8 family serine peptidase [Rhizobium leguminosarum]|nr:S8 family serine peptidase [Rhizobium leguminosarum bv. trifolii]